MKAKKSLGQNFLVNNSIIEKITNLIECHKDDLVIEIGPGRGALTKELAKKECQLLAIEIDKDMQIYLDNLHVNVLYEDILHVNLLDIIKEYDYRRLFIVGNLPYYITSPILELLVNLNTKIDKMVFMVQKEVANRYSSLSGTKEFGYMSLFLQFKYNVKKEFDVTKGNFNPIPKVDSSIISLVPNNKEYDVDLIEYSSFLKQAFSMKRKTLKNNLKSYDWSIIKKVLAENKLSETVRAENISQEIFVEIYKNLKR